MIKIKKDLGIIIVFGSEEEKKPREVKCAGSVFLLDRELQVTNSKILKEIYETYEHRYLVRIFKLSKDKHKPTVSDPLFKDISILTWGNRAGNVLNNIQMIDWVDNLRSLRNDEDSKIELLNLNNQIAKRLVYHTPYSDDYLLITLEYLVLKYKIDFNDFITNIYATKNI